MPRLQCCCGSLDCEYLKHNNVALSDLEKDVETAARLGQVSQGQFPSLHIIIAACGSYPTQPYPTICIRACVPFLLLRCSCLLWFCKCHVCCLCSKRLQKHDFHHHHNNDSSKTTMFTRKRTRTRWTNLRPPGPPHPPRIIHGRLGI